MDSLRLTDEQPTKDKWTCTFHAKNRLTRLPLMLFVKSQWNGYLARLHEEHQQALRIDLGRRSPRLTAPSPRAAQ